MFDHYVLVRAKRGGKTVSTSDHQAKARPGNPQAAAKKIAAAICRTMKGDRSCTIELVIRKKSSDSLYNFKIKRTKLPFPLVFTVGDKQFVRKFKFESV